MKFIAALAVIAVAVHELPSAAVRSEPRDGRVGFDTKEAGFSIRFGDEVAAYRDLSAFVLPGATLSVEAIGGPDDYVVHASEGTAAPRGSRRWLWRAPQGPGVYDLRFDGLSTRSKDEITLRVFVMVPATEVRNGFLNGYEIGHYPTRPLGGRAIYQPPTGFVEVTKGNEDVKVSPHFRLKQFLCKEDTDRPFPKYVVLRERLLLELEAVLERVNRLGYHVDTLHVMSGYRTPFYNHAIGDALFSLHQWGSAADFYIDKDDKNQMDDLNHDGRIDVGDAKYLYDIIEQMLADPAYAKFQGGMGFYPATSAHPPFVHVDVRGFKARWRG